MTNRTADDSNIWQVSIYDLPDEMLINIFSHMSFNELLGLQKVCSRWKMLSQRAELWINKEYEIGTSSKSDSDMCKCDKYDVEVIQTLCNAPNLRKIRFSRSASALVFHVLYTKCHRLTVLLLDLRQKLTYTELKNIVENCRKIHTLKIPSNMLKSQEFSKVVSQLQYLHLLELTGMNSIPLLWPLCDGCPQLSEVDFGFTDVDVDDLRYFLNAKRNTLKSIRIKWIVGKSFVLPLLTDCADYLERLELVKFHLIAGEARKAFTDLGNLKMKNLKELAMEISHPTPPGSFATAFKLGGLSKLKRLNLRLSYTLENDAVIAICCHCPDLRELKIVNSFILTDAAFSQIHRLENLEKITVRKCRALTAGVIPYFTPLLKLHTLWMEDMKFRKLLPGLSSILEISGLRCLGLNYSVITGMPFDKFPDKLINLRELHIDWCIGDSKAISVLSERMPDLQIHGRITWECQKASVDSEEEGDDESSDNDDYVDAARTTKWWDI